MCRDGDPFGLVLGSSASLRVFPCLYNWSYVCSLVRQHLHWGFQVLQTVWGIPVKYLQYRFNGSTCDINEIQWQCIAHMIISVWITVMPQIPSEKVRWVVVGKGEPRNRWHCSLHLPTCLNHMSWGVELLKCHKVSFIARVCVNVLGIVPQPTSRGSQADGRGHRPGDSCSCMWVIN